MEVCNLGSEVVGPDPVAIAEGGRGVTISPRCAANAEINPPRKERLEHAKLLCDFERGVMHEHNAPRSDPKGLGGAGDASREDFRRGAGKGLAAVVFGKPVAVEAEGFHVLGEAHGFPERLDRGAPRTDRGLIQYAEAHGPGGALRAPGPVWP